MIRMIISGGQTGVDQGALDFAIERGIAHGGFCPKGRRCETKQPISLKYSLWEMESEEYPPRTRKNILYADGTLIIRCGKPSGGTKLTHGICNAVNKAPLMIDIKYRLKPEKFVEYVLSRKVDILNVAGPRQSKHPGIQKSTVRTMHVLINALEAELGYKIGRVPSKK